MDTTDLTTFKGGSISEMDTLSDELNIDGGGNGIMPSVKSRNHKSHCGIICRIFRPKNFKSKPIVGPCRPQGPTNYPAN